MKMILGSASGMKGTRTSLSEICMHVLIDRKVEQSKVLHEAFVSLGLINITSKIRTTIHTWCTVRGILRCLRLSDYTNEDLYDVVYKIRGVVVKNFLVKNVQMNVFHNLSILTGSPLLWWATASKRCPPMVGNNHSLYAHIYVDSIDRYIKKV